MRVVVDAHRHSHLRCAHHVDGSLVAFEYFEHLSEESRCEKHAAAFDLYGRDIVFCCHSLYLAALGAVADGGAFSLRVHGVEQFDGYSCKLGRLYACGVEDFCTEVS